MENSSVIKKVQDFFLPYKKAAFSQGSTLISPQKDPGNVYYLVSGSVKMYAVSEDGEEIILHIFRDNSFFPLMLFLSETKNTYYYEAVSDTVVAIAPYDKVTSFVRSDPEILIDLSIRFSKAITGLLTRIEGLAFQEAFSKVLSLFLYVGEKFGTPSSDGIFITLELTHQDIASWVSVRRETASRQLEKMTQEGLIHMRDRHYVISSMEALKQSLSDKKLE